MFGAKKFPCPAKNAFRSSLGTAITSLKVSELATSSRNCRSRELRTRGASCDNLSSKQASRNALESRISSLGKPLLRVFLCGLVSNTRSILFVSSFFPFRLLGPFQHVRIVALRPGGVHTQKGVVGFIHLASAKVHSRKSSVIKILRFARLLRRAGPLPCESLGFLLPTGPQLFTELPTRCVLGN
jgi:hypothetical protein